MCEYNSENKRMEGFQAAFYKDWVASTNQEAKLVLRCYELNLVLDRDDGITYDSCVE